MKKIIVILMVLVVYAGVAFAGEKARDGRFIAYDNEAVLDTKTNLMWADKDNGYDINWQGAKNYCENYRGGGYTDWRMPTQYELAGLYDAGQTQSNEAKPAYSLHLTKLINLTSCCIWASETRGSESTRFNFYYGRRGWVHHSGSYYRALPVRSAK